jgi:ABC-2 type transport system permease protein
LILRGLLVRTMLTSRFDPTATSLGGLLLVQLIVATLGVLLMSGEYSTAAIRSAFAAVPKRLPMLWAKAAVFGVTTFVLLAAASLAAFLGQPLLSGKHLGTSLSDPGVLRAVLGAAGFASPEAVRTLT